jgi:hypothetical protein
MRFLQVLDWLLYHLTEYLNRPQKVPPVPKVSQPPKSPKP